MTSQRASSVTKSSGSTASSTAIQPCSSKNATSRALGCGYGTDASLWPRRRRAYGTQRVESNPTLRLSTRELDTLATDGYVVRESAFTASELADIIDACEQLVDDLVRDRQGNRLKAGSYVFDPDFTRDVIIKWEGDSDVVHGVEPCAHLSPALDAWAHDPRFLVPMCDFTGS